MKLSLIFSFILILCAPLCSFSQGAKTRTLDPQTKEVMIKVDGLNRTFVVHLPPAYKSQPQSKFPVVFMFHGGGGGGKNAFETTGWKEVGDREGFITVFPSAYKTCIIKEGTQSTKNYWMTTGKLASLCPGQAAHDDVKFVRAILSYMKKSLRLNTKRIYASGFSNGMGLSLSKVVPELADVFAAVGGVGSVLQTSPRPVNDAPPMFAMLGEDDDRFYTKAGTSSLPITEADLEANAFMKDMQNNILDMLQLGPTYQVRDKPKYLEYRFTTSTGNGAPELRFAVLKGIKHVFPKGRAKADNGIVAAEVLWEFFKAYQK